MGICVAKVDKANDSIDQKMEQERLIEEHKYKLLLLGAGDSGKTTLLKQMRQIHGSPVCEEELKDYKNYIIQNTIEAMRTLAIYSELLAENGDAETKVQEENENVCTEIAMMQDEHVFTQTELEKFQQLWNDKGIKKTLEHRNKFQLIDSAEYLFDNMAKFTDPNYVPEFEDYIRSRKRTTGVNKISFHMKSPNNKSVIDTFEIFDVGGQRNERRKWIKVFDNVAAIIFVVSLSGYNLTLWEDASQNCMTEALSLFKFIVNMDDFKNVHMILFFNKSDIFDMIYKKDSFSKYFPQFTGDNNNKQEIIEFLHQEFSHQQKYKNKIVYSHVTCAIDTDNTKKVFSCVRDIVVRSELGKAGLM